MSADKPAPGIRTTDLPYRDEDTPLTGVLCDDETQSGDRPGILLIHGGAGLDGHAREQALRYAALGYTVLACDMFGAGTAGNRDRIMAAIGALWNDPALLVRRVRAGLAALSGSGRTDGRAAVVGFCFGGMAALQLARSGEPVAASVSLHGSLATTVPASPGGVRARVLVCHGASDPHVPLADVTAFAEEMNQASADWRLVMYGGVQHGFTHAHARPGDAPGVAYDEAADIASFDEVRGFLASSFAR